jgi:hypothetical protein
MKIISWLGTISSIIGSFLLAFQIALIGYCAFMLGSISWLAVGLYSKNKPLVVLNGTFFLANCIGLYNVI